MLAHHSNLRLNAPDDVAARGELARRRLVGLTIAGLVLTSFSIRFWLLQHAVSEGTYSPTDADHYLRNARFLAQYGAGWRWTLEAIEYPWDGRLYFLPPLYPIFLSVFVLASDAYDYWAAVAQIVLNATSIAALYVVGESIHSRRAGMIAAIIYTFWLSSIWRFSLFIQEQLYIPLLIAAFALLVRASARQGSAAAFFAAGAVFGGAALTRSMPMYFIFPAAAAWVILDRDRLAVSRATALLLGFLLVTGSYSLWLSSQLGQFVFIENHAGISIQRYGTRGVQGAPGFVDIVQELVAAFWRTPAQFFAVWSGYALALFHLHADRWLHAYSAPTAERAVAARFVALAGIALPFIICVVLAPLGTVLARRRREAALIASWVVLVVVLTALSAAGGVRYRSPFEPHLIVLSAVVLAGAWRRPGRVALISALLATALAAWTVFVQVPRVLRARSNYGVLKWSGAELGWRSGAVGAAGFNLLPTAAGSLELAVLPPPDRLNESPTHVAVRIDGHPLADRVLGAEPLRFRFHARHGSFHFVEVTARGPDGEPAPIEIEVVR